jgi:hypothetical protein
LLLDSSRLPVLARLRALPADAERFRLLAVSGSLYDLLTERSGLARDLVKRAFLRDVLAKRGR